MVQAFLSSARLYAACFFQSFSTKGRAAAPLKPLRLLLLLIGFPLFTLLQIAHWIGFALDEVFFRAYRHVRIERPLFVTGLPRSGTTFVHRTLAHDRENFTSFRTWEAIMAPSVVERRFWKMIAALDRAMGAPCKRFLDRWIRQASGDFSAVHAIGLDAEEEDYLALLPAAGCFILVLAFPWSEALWRLARFSRMEADRRDALVDYYYRCLQKHLYVEGRGHKRLLSKNAAFASWIPFLEQKMPDARFLVCVREPVSGLSSQLSSVEGGCALLGTQGGFHRIAERFGTVFSDSYDELFQKTLAQTRLLAVIDQEELRTSPRETLKTALDYLQEPLGAAWEESLNKAENRSKNHQSAHQHGRKSASLAKASIKPCVLNAYQAILAQRRNRAQARPNASSS